MKTRLLMVLFVTAALVVNAAKINSVVSETTVTETYLSSENTQTPSHLSISQPRKPGGGNKAFRRLHNKIFTVSVFKYNKKIRVNRDKQLKASKHNNKSARAHKNSKNSKHILLRGSEGSHSFKNKRRW
jgi:hypothetical protein